MVAYRMIFFSILCNDIMNEIPFSRYEKLSVWQLSCFQCRSFDFCKNSCTGNLTAAELTNFLRQLSTLTTVTLRSCQWTPAILYGKVNLETYIYNMYNEGHGVVGLMCFLFCCCAVTHSSKSSFHSILHKKFR